MLNNTFSIEHICPNSCDWKDMLDKDRLGNLFPIHVRVNSSRSNRHLSEYLKVEHGNDFYKYLDDIVPRFETYDLIVQHVGNKDKPTIVNNKLYDDMCKKNEDVYKDTFLNCLYDVCEQWVLIHFTYEIGQR